MSLVDLLPDPRPPRKIAIESAIKLHLDWVVGLELAFEAVTLRALKRALRPVTAKFAGITAAAGEPFVSIDDINSIRTTWSHEVAEELMPLLGEVYMTGSQSTNIAIGAVSTDIPDVVSVGAQEWLGLSQNRMNRIGDAAWLNMRAQLLEGFQQGESIDDLAKRVRLTANMTAAQARTVARTEVVGASNAGSFAEARVMEVQFKTWLNTDDPRTRPTHVRAGDQRVQMDETFIVGGARLRFPHDPLGPPGETINCRCTLLFDEQPLCVCSPGWVRNELKTVTAAGQPDCGCSEPLPQLQTETDPKLPEPTKEPLHDTPLPSSTAEARPLEKKAEEKSGEEERIEEEEKEKEEKKEERKEEHEERKEKRDEKKEEREKKREEDAEQAREEGDAVDGSWELGYESGYETGYEAGLEGEPEDISGGEEESHDAENEKHFVNGYEKGYSSGYEAGLEDHEAEEEEKRREAEFDILGLLTFPVRHSPTTGRFVPGRGGGGGRSKKPPQIVRKRGDDPNAPERAKAAKTRQRAIARAKAKQKPGDFGEGANFDQEKAKEFGEEGFKEWRGNLTSSQRSSIKAYTDSGFAKGINDRLRGVPLDSENAGRVKTIDKHIGNIRAAFDAPGARTPAAVTAHRVMSGPLAERIISEHRNGRLLTSAGGAKFRDSGIVSTSLDRSIATKSSASQNKRVTLEIDVPKGQKAVYPGSLSRFPIESELLLPPGTAFEVTGAGNRGGVLNLKVRIIDSL